MHLFPHRDRHRAGEVLSAIATTLRRWLVSQLIAMVVIGGTTLTGGRGTIIGTVMGVLILRVMRNGIVLIGVPGLAYNIFVGAIILGMMALHSWLEHRHHAGT